MAPSTSPCVAVLRHPSPLRREGQNAISPGQKYTLSHPLFHAVERGTRGEAALFMPSSSASPCVAALRRPSPLRREGQKAGSAGQKYALSHPLVHGVERGTRGEVAVASPLRREGQNAVSPDQKYALSHPLVHGVERGTRGEVALASPLRREGQNADSAGQKHALSHPLVHAVERGTRGEAASAHE
jgi:hypothetical protein